MSSISQLIIQGAITIATTVMAVITIKTTIQYYKLQKDVKTKEKEKE